MTSPDEYSILPLLPMMERMHKKRTCDSYRIVPGKDDDRGMHVIAAQDIDGGAVILIESALYSQPTEHHPSLLKLEEYQSITAKLRQGDPEQAYMDMSVERREALNRLQQLNAAAYYEDNGLAQTRTKQCTHDIWQLEDSHRQAQVGDRVLIEGLQSQAGKKLNGRGGRVSQQDETDPNRLGVQLFANGTNNTGTVTTTRSIKSSNLKTLGGIFRTNAYEDMNDEYTKKLLFKELCRVNHACGDASNVYRTIHHGKAYITAKRDIPQGEELLVDYIPNTHVDRRAKLHEMFNFWCQCCAH